MRKIRSAELKKLAEKQHDLILDISNLMCKYSKEMQAKTQIYFSEMEALKNEDN